MKIRPELYYYEVEPGRQTQNFNPQIYIDISSVSDRKKAACYLHESQKMKELYSTEFSKLESFRGWESGRVLAEAYAGHFWNRKPFIKIVQS
jgi:LmbE family N-acetylglucosaminyl deacetylase